MECDNMVKRSQKLWWEKEIGPPTTVGEMPLVHGGITASTRNLHVHMNGWCKAVALCTSPMQIVWSKKMDVVSAIKTNAMELWSSEWGPTVVLSSVAFLIIFYNIFLNKKQKLPPGPAAVPIFGNWLQVGNDLNHVNLTGLAEKYGDIYLLKMGQRNLVVVSTPELAKEVLLTQGMEFGSRARNVVLDVFTNKGQDLAFTVYGDHWRRLRRIATVPFFTSKVVRQFRKPWEHEIEKVMTDLAANPKASSPSEGVVIRHRLQTMMYNVIYSMTFGCTFDRDDDPIFKRLKFLNGERSRLSQSFQFNYGDFIPILRPFLKKYLRTCKTIQNERLELFNKAFVEPRRKLLASGVHVEKKVGVDYLFEAVENGEITNEQLLLIIENLNVAALETTLWSIEWGIAEMVNNKSIQEKLREELDQVLQGRPITEPDLESGRLPYLAAVVKETLRRRMAGPFLLPHMNLNPAKLGGYDIPAGSKILVNSWWIANSPKYWDEPMEFKPERFLGTKIEASGNDFKFLPFGAGRRSCPGIVVAMPIIGLVFGRILQRFELLTPAGINKIDMTEKGGQMTLRIANHYTVVVKPRN